MASDYNMTVSYLASANSYGGFSDGRAQVYIHPQSDPYFENLSQMVPGEGFDMSMYPPGSRGHSAGVCRPCAWYWKPKGCWHGKDCPHCHLLHPRTKLKKPKTRTPKPDFLLNQRREMVHTDFTPAPLDYLAPVWQPGGDVASAAAPWNWQVYDEEIPPQTDLASGSSALSETSSQVQVRDPVPQEHRKSAAQWLAEGLGDLNAPQASPDGEALAMPVLRMRL
ncbi:unnamed protein product [Symbiodinium sp. CCMP2592]|nr:unnamed protein product [Symbiodinium sp. CCMP2592]